MARARSGLLDRLVAQGISEPAARIFLLASREGPLTAAEAARLAAVHRVHGYRFLRELVGQGLLRPDGHRPQRFAALPVEELVDRWIQSTTEELDRLRRDRIRLLEDSRAADAGSGSPDGRRFTVLEGQSAIHAFLRRRFGAARKEILISVGGFALARAVDGGIDRALAAARSRGVRVRVVTEISGANLAEAKLFLPACELRHARRPVANRAVLIDRAQAAIFVSGEEGLGASGEAQVLLVTGDPRFLALTREYHQRLWADSDPATVRLVSIESPPRALLPVPRDRMEEPFQRLREISELGMAATGLTELSLDLPDLIEAVATQIGHQIGDGLDGRTPEAVARSLADFYGRHATGRLHVVRDRPLTLKITDCFACRTSPEVGRVLCPGVIAAALERRLGEKYDVSKPDPSRHATRGCLFAVRRA